MNIAVIGPCGSVGRQIVQQVVVERLLQCDQRLTLVANADGSSAASVYGLASDLHDAYSEICPDIEILTDAAALQSDLIVVAAGATPRSTLDEAPMTRDGLAAANAPIFRRYADALAKHGSGHEIVLCVSNPNELAVHVFAQALGSSRVIGMGSYLDSMRFRREIANDLGIRRQAVHAFMVGEHGSGMVPLWSGVHVYGFDSQRLRTAIERMRPHRIDAYPDAVSDAFAQVSSLIRERRMAEAYRLVAALPPDVRVAVGPFVTHYSGAKTVIATARATMEFIRTITQGADALVCGQVSLNGTYGIQGTVGVPFVVGNRGVDRVFELPMTDAEKALLQQSAHAIRDKITTYA